MNRFPTSTACLGLFVLWQFQLFNEVDAFTPNCRLAMYHSNKRSPVPLGGTGTISSALMLEAPTITVKRGGTGTVQSKVMNVVKNHHRGQKKSSNSKMMFRIAKTTEPQHQQTSSSSSSSSSTRLFQPKVVYEVEPPVTDPYPPSQLVSAVGLRPGETSSSSSTQRLPLTSLRKGDVVSGTISKILPYGVLVQTVYDIPNNRHPQQVGNALLHESNIPRDMPLSSFQVGQVIDHVRVSQISYHQGTVYLSLLPPTMKSSLQRRSSRTAIGTPTSSYNNKDTAVPVVLEENQFRVGMEIPNARVVRIVPYGAFVDIGHPSGRQALLHVTRMSLYKVGDITQHVTVGQRLTVRIIHLSTTDKHNNSDDDAAAVSSTSSPPDIAVSILSKENDAFVDRRQLQMKRMELWRQVVRSTSTSITAASSRAHTGNVGNLHPKQQPQDGDHPEEENGAGTNIIQAKRELLQIDRQLWDLLSDYMDTPKTMEI
jgi:predicted RNA-binding protein with RPS1 domain